MFYISNVFNTPPAQFTTDLQKEAYRTLGQLKIPFERVETDEAISMEDCILINEKLNMEMVKTLFLCNKKKTLFYLFITAGAKSFNTKNFCKALDISRVSFAPQELFEEILGTKIGAATVFSTLTDWEKAIQVVFDRDVVQNEYYGCSDGTTTGYMKVKTDHILNILLPHSKHTYKIIDL